MIPKNSTPTSDLVEIARRGAEGPSELKALLDRINLLQYECDLLWEAGDVPGWYSLSYELAAARLTLNSFRRGGVN
ncbi:MAG: hypothetical protein QGI10_00105 [Vicinamibacterales bacterium]|nr:hypothetical protein [Vicinamibacterales bacterium]MDP7477649.1 hypothetical protein [Vicinamibacterales bacterium]